MKLEKLHAVMFNAAEEKLEKKKKLDRRLEISDKTKQLIEEKQKAYENGNEKEIQ